MNKIVLVGRLTKDPEVRATQDSTSITRFTLAVTRRVNREVSDFISCVAWRGTADFIGKYFKKGMPMMVVGELHTGVYEKDGQKVYTTDVIVQDVEFAPISKSVLEEPVKTEPKIAEPAADEWEATVNDMLDDNDLPF